MVTNRHLHYTPAVAALLALGAVHWTTVPSAKGQIQDTLAKQDIAVIVDGSVQSVFQSEDEQLVQILVQRSEVPGLDAVAGTRYPAPGEYVYAHVQAGSSILGRIAGRSGASTLPTPGTRIRALLKQGQGGQWEAAGKDWYQDNPEAIADRYGRGTSGRDVRSLGVSSERISLGGQSALKVTQVDRDSPAARAGIEPGDILVKANGVALASQDQLNALFGESRGDFAVTVRDVRSGRDVLVDIDSGVVSSDAGAGVTPGQNRRMEPLGASTELAFYQGEAALKVTSVEPDSPAEQAGIVAGLVILKANGKPITKPEQLTAAEQESRGRLELQVVNPRDRREKVIKVAL